MTRKGNKLFLKIYVSEAKTLEEAIGKKGKLAHVITATQKEAGILLEAIGVEISPPEWSDYEEDVPEMGFTKDSDIRHRDERKPSLRLGKVRTKRN